MTQLVDFAYYRQNIDRNLKLKQNMQNQTISDLYTDEKKIKIFQQP